MGSQPRKERRPFTHFAIKHGFSHQKRFLGLSLPASPAGRQIPSVPQQITRASCLHYVVVMMCLLLAQRGSDSAELLAMTVEIFQALSWICSFPLPIAIQAHSAEHKTLLWKKRKKKKKERSPLRFLFHQKRMDLQPSGHSPAFQTQALSSGWLLLSEVRHIGWL